MIFVDEMRSPDLFDTKRSVLEELNHPLFVQHDVRVLVKRDDLIDDDVSGNKWRKLKYNLLQMDSLGKKGVLTFGGAYSNHLVATASAANKAGVRSVGIVRGNELNTESNDTLKRCAELGMQMAFVSRQEYSEKNDSEYLSVLKTVHSDLYIVPEGGANFYGMIGCQEIVKEIDEEFDAVFIAQGTTTTSCGVLSAMKDQKLYVVPVLKGFDSLAEMKILFSRSGFDEGFQELLFSKCQVLDEYHFGGYGKYTAELLDFIRKVHVDTGLKLDPIYTGKTFYALMDQVSKGYLDGKTVVFIHTGGLQGVTGIEKREGITLFD